MSKYSDKYTQTYNVTYAGRQYPATKLMQELYSFNEDFDNSILYTASEVFDNLKLYLSPRGLSTAEFISNKAIKEQTPIDCKIGLCMISSYPYELIDSAKFQWGVGDRSTYNKSNGDNRFIKNAKLQDYIFNVKLNINGTLYNVETIENVLDKWYETNIQFEIGSYYWDSSNNIWVQSPVQLGVVIYDNDKILGVYNVAELFKLNRLNFTYYTDFRAYLYQTSTTKIENFKDYPDRCYFLSSEFPKDEEAKLYGTEVISNPVIYENEFFRLTESKVGSNNYSSISTFLSVDYIYKILASFGMYFTNVDLGSNTYRTTNFNSLLSDGKLWLGEMDEDGRTTGNWLHTPAEIRNAYNYDINTENEDFDPNKKPEKEDYEDDKSDDIKFGNIFEGGGAFTNLWYCTSSELTQLKNWFNGFSEDNPMPENFEPISQIIGLYQYPIALGGDVTQEIIFKTQAGIPVHTGVNAARGLSGDLKFELGSINIPKRMKERGVPFLDYESIVEVYIPFCGVFQLDTQTVIGKTISAIMWLNPATGECNCIVYTESDGIKAPVAYGSGNMSSQIPIASGGWGTYTAALKEATFKKNQITADAILGEIGSLGQAASTANTLALGEQIANEAISGVFGAVGAAVGGAAAVAGIVGNVYNSAVNIQGANIGISHLKSKSGTSINGSFSGTSSWHYPFNAYIKITRPRYKKPLNYAHTQGIPLVSTRTLGSCNGFTMCVGTDLSNLNATEVEKELISFFLNNGVIV